MADAAMFKALGLAPRAYGGQEDEESLRQYMLRKMLMENNQAFAQQPVSSIPEGLIRALTSVGIGYMGSQAREESEEGKKNAARELAKMLAGDPPVSREALQAREGQLRGAAEANPQWAIEPPGEMSAFGEGSPSIAFGGMPAGGVHPVTGRPILSNPDGTISTERSITVEDERLNSGRPTNIPTIWDGKQLSEEDAIARAARAGGFPAFSSVEEAVNAARARSDSLSLPEPPAAPIPETPESAAAKQGVLPGSSSFGSTRLHEKGWLPIKPAQDALAAYDKRVDDLGAFFGGMTRKELQQFRTAALAKKFFPEGKEEKASWTPFTGYTEKGEPIAMLVNRSTGETKVAGGAKKEKPSAAEAAMARIKEQWGVSDQTAQGVVDGVLELKQDKAGNPVVINRATQSVTLLPKPAVGESLPASTSVPGAPSTASTGYDPTTWKPDPKALFDQTDRVLRAKGTSVAGPWAALTTAITPAISMLGGEGNTEVVSLKDHLEKITIDATAAIARSVDNDVSQRLWKEFQKVTAVDPKIYDSSELLMNRIAQVKSFLEREWRSTKSILDNPQLTGADASKAVQRLNDYEDVLKAINLPPTLRPQSEDPLSIKNYLQGVPPDRLDEFSKKGWEVRGPDLKGRGLIVQPRNGKPFLFNPDAGRPSPTQGAAPAPQGEAPSAAPSAAPRPRAELERDLAAEMAKPQRDPAAIQRLLDAIDQSGSR